MKAMKAFKNANPQIVISQHQQKWTLVNTDNNNDFEAGLLNSDLV